MLTKVSTVMKPPRIMATILFFLACLCMPIACWSQGTVNFRNSPVLFVDGIDRYVYLDFLGGTRLVGSSYVAELRYGTDASSLNAVAPLVAPFRDIPPDDLLAGIWRGDTTTLNGFTEANLVTLQVRVWDMSIFSTYDQASSSPGAIFGASQPFSYRVPPLGILEGHQIENFRAFALVPEPSVLFLGPLLVTLFLVFSRRNNRH